VKPQEQGLVVVQHLLMEEKIVAVAAKKQNRAIHAIAQSMENMANGLFGQNVLRRVGAEVNQETELATILHQLMEERIASEQQPNHSNVVQVGVQLMVIGVLMDHMDHAQRNVEEESNVK